MSLFNSDYVIDNIINLYIVIYMSEGRQREISLQPIQGELQMSLLSSDEKQQSAQEMGPQIEQQIIKRKLQYNDGIIAYTSDEQHSAPNLIRNQKYSAITFIPQVLYEQFKYFFNMFYLLTALSQLIPALKVGLMFTFMAPLLLVLTLTMLKQGYEDYQRYLKDKEVNSTQFTVIDLNNKNKYKKKSSELIVGDIIQVSSGQTIPADCLLMNSLDGKGSIFIKTDQLDGETDWKLRKSIIQTEQFPNKFTILFEEPQINIYKFIGSMTVQGEQVFGLGLENTVWRGVKVASGKARIMVIYTGKNTKLTLNMKQASTKFGKIDAELNFFSKILFAIMTSLSLLLILMHGAVGTAGDSIILFFKYFLLLSSIIPISMRVNLDFAKLVYKFMIDRDKNMTNALCRNSNIPEQLGRIEYILSDKTGTLTQNQMIFRKLYIHEECKYQSDDTDSLMKILNSGIKPCQKLNVNEKNMRNFDNATVDAITALMICHNVTPVEEDDGSQGLQGSSPDQITLVKFGQHLGYKLIKREQQFMEIKAPDGSFQKYNILIIFPFTSESKRMGIIVQNQETKQIVLYLKGADAVIEPKISTVDSDFMIEACSDLARQGLRTLVITQKVLEQEFYNTWKKSFDNANAALKDREIKIQKCREQLEGGMTFLAVTGVEDKLQENVVETVGSARSIGIKVWMLTGDKVQTAICVGRAVKLIQSREQQLFIIEGVTNAQTFKQKLQEFYKVVGLRDFYQMMATQKINCVLVIDGSSLKFALSDIQQEFFNIAVRLPAIICSRVSPTQKADVATLVIKYNGDKGRVLGIGDGGNDVALIQSAHVGVGIYGKQGIQAALASDFSIGQFKDLNELIYWHGRLAYKRSSLLAQFIIHRGTIITIMQTIFIIQFYYVPLPIFNGILMLGYSTVFTMLPVFSLILDEDITRKVAQRYPILYKSTQEGDQVSSYSFLYWMFISCYQGAIIMILITVALISESFYMVTTVAFTCLILIEFLNVFTEINKIHYLQVISTLISIAIYVSTIFLMKNILNGTQLFSTNCFPITLLIVFIAWGPPFFYQWIKRCLNPTQEQKIMKQVLNQY